MPPAARVGDMHVCPMQTPAVVPIPHVGGPILPPGALMVLIGNMPAACMGDMAVCVGPPDSIVKGSMVVLIGNKPAARMGDNCAHGGTIVMGFPMVMIGDSGSGGGGGGAAMAAAKASASPFSQTNGSSGTSGQAPQTTTEAVTENVAEEAPEVTESPTHSYMPGSNVEVQNAGATGAELGAAAGLPPEPLPPPTYGGQVYETPDDGESTGSNGGSGGSSSGAAAGGASMGSQIGTGTPPAGASGAGLGATVGGS